MNPNFKDAAGATAIIGLIVLYVLVAASVTVLPYIVVAHFVIKYW